MVNRYICAALPGAGACLLLLGASCSSGDRANPLALYPASPEGHMALLRGTLELEDSCLYVAVEGGERWLAAFPHPATEWIAGDRAVRVEDTVLRVGEKGTFQGGEAGTGSTAIPWVQAPAESCDGSRVWLVTGLGKP